VKAITATPVVTTNKSGSSKTICTETEENCGEATETITATNITTMINERKPLVSGNGRLLFGVTFRSRTYAFIAGLMPRLHAISNCSEFGFLSSEPINESAEDSRVSENGDKETR